MEFFYTYHASKIDYVMCPSKSTDDNMSKNLNEDEWDLIRQ
jgi:hypothetical protein